MRCEQRPLLVSRQPGHLRRHALTDLTGTLSPIGRQRLLIVPPLRVPDQLVEEPDRGQVCIDMNPAEQSARAVISTAALSNTHASCDHSCTVLTLH